MGYTKDINYSVGYKEGRNAGHRFVDDGNIDEVIHNSKIILDELSRLYGENDPNYLLKTKI